MVSEIGVDVARLPETPFTLIDAVPGAAVPSTVKVNVLLLVVVAGLKTAVTPLGSPEADRLTLPLKPFCAATVTVLVAVPPCRTVNAAGNADKPKVGTGVTVRAIVVVVTTFPDVPIMVTFTVPAAAVLPAVNVNVLVVVVLVGRKTAVTPLGRPDADKSTVPLKPFCGAI